MQYLPDFGIGLKAIQGKGKGPGQCLKGDCGVTELMCIPMSCVVGDKEYDDAGLDLEAT